MATWITPVDVSPTTGSWQDVDVSAQIPAGSTGVMLHVVNAGQGSSWLMGYRKNGSTDARTNLLLNDSHMWAAIGVDANRIFEVYLEYTELDVYLVGYFGAEAVFFDNASDVTPGSTGSWVDVDISALTGGNTAVAAILETLEPFPGGYDYGLRKNGSTDNRFAFQASHCGAIIGVDGSEIFESYIEHTDRKMWLVGYLTSGVTMLTNATDLSMSTTAAYADLAALPAGATGGFIQVINTGLTDQRRGALRKNGSAEDIYGLCRDHIFAMVETGPKSNIKSVNSVAWANVKKINGVANASVKTVNTVGSSSGIIEGKISHIELDFFLVGYTT